MKVTRQEVLQISEQAVTPFWLKPHMYTKLESEAEEE
jgi:hypothetical protein